MFIEGFSRIDIYNNLCGENNITIDQNQKTFFGLFVDRFCKN